MNYYILMLRRETIDFTKYSPEDYQKILADFDKWNNEMISKGQLVLSGNLSDKESKIVKHENIVKDGPYSEISEAVTGFFIICAKDSSEAAKIASGCPFIIRGGSVEAIQVPQLEFEDAALPIVMKQVENREKGKRESDEK